MAKSLVRLTDKQIEAKKEAFLSDITKKSELSKQGRTTPAQIFLDKIKDVIKVALEGDLSYKEIAKSIYDQWNVKISDQTIKRFAENTLGIKKERKTQVVIKKVIATEAKADATTTIPETPKEPSQDKKELTQTDGVKHEPANFDDI